MVNRRKWFQYETMGLETGEIRMSDPEYTVGVWDMTFYKIDVETDQPLQNKDGTIKVFYSNNIDAGYWASGIDPNDLIEMEEQDD